MTAATASCINVSFGNRVVHLAGSCTCLSHDLGTDDVFHNIGAN